MSTIIKNPDYNKEVSLKESAMAFREGKEVLLVCYAEDGQAYAAQLFSCQNPQLSEINEMSFGMLADAKFYIKEPKL
jgi:hypothetical protein